MTRYVNFKGLKEYLSVGRPAAKSIADAAGAKVRVSGKIYRYDLKAIDRYMAALRCPEGEEAAEVLELSM